MIIRQHDPMEELKTLCDEMEESLRRLKSSDDEAKPVILNQVCEIQRDIKRNSKKIRDQVKNATSKASQ